MTPELEDSANWGSEKEKTPAELVESKLPKGLISGTFVSSDKLASADKSFLSRSFRESHFRTVAEVLDNQNPKLPPMTGGLFVVCEDLASFEAGLKYNGSSIDDLAERLRTPRIFIKKAEDLKARKATLYKRTSDT